MLDRWYGWVDNLGIAKLLIPPRWRARLLKNLEPLFTSAVLETSPSVFKVLKQLHKGQFMIDGTVIHLKDVSESSDVERDRRTRHTSWWPLSLNASTVCKLGRA